MPLSTEIFKIRQNFINFEMTFSKNYVVICLELIMFKKLNIKEIIDSFALLVIAAIVGTIVSFVVPFFDRLR